MATQGPEKKQKQQQQQKTSLLSQGLIGLTWIILFFFLGSYLITETWTWGYRGKWTNINTYIPVSIKEWGNLAISTKYLIMKKRKEMIFTEQQLLEFDGSDPKKPIYLAIE